MPTNGGEALAIVIAILLGITLPITSLQILWANMVTAVMLSLTLAFEPAENDVMRRSPRNPEEPLLDGFLVWRIAFVTGLLALGVLGVFWWQMEQGAELEAARTAAVNALVMGQIGYLFNARHILGSSWSREGLAGNRCVPLAIGVLVPIQILFTHLPATQALFATAPIGAGAWGQISAVGILVFVLVEAEKVLLRKGRNAAAGTAAQL